MNKKQIKKIIIMIVLFSTILLSFDVKLSLIGISTIFISIFIKKPLWWIYFMLYYLSFEILIQNFIPNSLVGITRYGVELLSYLILIISIIKALLSRKKIYFYKYDKILLLFLITGVISSLINVVDIKIFIMGMRWIIRYVVIYYIFKFNSFSKQDLIKLVNSFYYLILIQLIIGLSQFIFRSQLEPVLKPRVVELDFHTILTTQLESKFAIYSTFGRYGEYAYFVTLAVLFMFTKYIFDKNRKNLILLSITALVLVLTYARQALLGVLISIGIYIYINNIKKNISKIKISFIIGIGLVFLVGYIVYSDFQVGKGILNESVAQRYLSIFSSDYLIRDIEGQGRLYFLTTVNGKFLTTKPLFGYGVGMYGTEPAIKYNQSVYNALNIPTSFSMDVYLTSILGQVGIIGCFLLYKIYYEFYRVSKIMSRKSKGFEQFISIFIILVFFAIMVGSFFGSNLSDRYQAFYVWMFFGILDRLKVLDTKKNILN